MILTRYGSTPFGTLGELKVSGHKFYTIEKPWRDNQPMVSCVPLGEYSLIWLPTTTSVPSEYNGHTWYLEGETVGLDAGRKARSRCCIHVGNVDDDVQGCIAIGMGLGYIDKRWAVTGSRVAMSVLLDVVGPIHTELVITTTTAG